MFVLAFKFISTVSQVKSLLLRDLALKLVLFFLVKSALQHLESEIFFISFDLSPACKGSLQH